MAKIDYESRPTRPCVGCGNSDKAPRHLVALPDGNTAYYHYDCHVLITNSEVSKAVLATAGGHTDKGKKNEDLAQHLADVAEKELDKQARIFTTTNASGDPNVELVEGVN